MERYRRLRIGIRCERQAGFTLIELMISLVIFGVAMTAIYTSYLTQQKTYVAQTQVQAMQQNLRAAMYHLERELRMAGYDANNTAGAGFLVADNDQIQFTGDLNDDGDLLAGGGPGFDTNENITYAIVDNQLKRTSGLGTPQPLADNIEALDLVFLDASNTPLNPGGGDVAAGSLASVRAVEITMVARTDQPDPQYRDAKTYVNQQGFTVLGVQNDGYRRRLLTSTVRCRNMGI